jgi:hypothetical protein
VVVEVGDVNESLGLFNQRLGDVAIGMAQGRHRDAPAQVQVSFARNVIKVTPFAMSEHEFEAGVTRHHIFLEKLLHGSHVIPNDGRRNKVFHGWMLDVGW